MLFICYPKCTTCKKAKKWLEDNGIEYTQRHIVEDNPTVEELNRWQTRSGLPRSSREMRSGKAQSARPAFIRLTMIRAV